VAPAEIGAATGSLTFFQQIGGTVGLTITSTLFVSRLASEIPVQLRLNGVPDQVIAAFAGGGGSDILGTGDLGQRILASVPPDLQAAIAPLVPAIVQAIHQAFSIAIAQSLWVAIGAAILAAVAVLFLREEPMRTTFEMGAAPLG
jgi:hypothetical protein